MQRVQIQLTSEQADRLRERARQRRLSTAAIVREAVDSALRDLAGTMTNQERWQRSRSVVGKYRSGSPDPVSSEHDRYLEDIYRS
jgi:ribbon-helix-helix CopG family protein